MSRCDSCNRDFLHGEEVVMESVGVWLNGKFEQSEESSLRHDECEDDDG